MKLQYAVFLCAVIALCILLIAGKPVLVAAQNNDNYLTAQPEIGALVALAIPPYKW